MAFAFVFLIVAGQFGYTTCQNCGFPSSWQGDYWWSSHSYTSPTNIVTRLFRKYDTSSEIRFYHMVEGSHVGGMKNNGKIDCREDSVINEQQRYYVRDSDNRDETRPECISINMDKENKMLVQYRIEVPHETVSMSCSTQPYTLLPKVFIKYPFVFDAACPFAYDLYSITVRRAGDAQPMCGSGRNTISIARQKSQLTISACFSQNSFEQPFHGATLRCVGDLEPEVISSTSQKGKVYIFGYTSASHIPDILVSRFYTARYMEAANGTVFMSLQGRTDVYLKPDGARDYRSVDALDNSNTFSYAFAMSPTCRYVPCKNGGSCQDSRCACPSGYTSFFCETDIDDCLPDPCSGNGNCTDHPNRFSCDCYHGYQGLTCETAISCEDALCENGATCETDVNKVFMCVCPVDFTGVLCETSMITTVASVTTRPDSSTSAIARSTTSSSLLATTPSIARSTTLSPLSATTLDSNNTAGPQAQSGGSSDATPTIIGVVVAVLVGIIILAVVAYVIQSRRKKLMKADDTEALNGETL